MTTTNKEREFKGILITNGADFTIHGLRIGLSPNGVDASISGVSLRQDLCRHWLQIAVNHTLLAASANTDLLAADLANDETALGSALEHEFQASMQAIVASAVGLDALYSAVKHRIHVPEAQTKAWRQNRTARWKQMADVFRLGFPLRNSKVAEVRKILQEIAKYRGWAVHPPCDQQAPVHHPEIARGVEWRFMAFRYLNAQLTVRMALNFAHVFASHPRPRTKELAAYCQGLCSTLVPILEDWGKHFPNLRTH
jgi:hypothetical protein